MALERGKSDVKSSFFRGVAIGLAAPWVWLTEGGDRRHVFVPLPAGRRTVTYRCLRCAAVWPTWQRCLRWSHEEGCRSGRTDPTANRAQAEGSAEGSNPSVSAMEGDEA
jgi:hypothetical protein